MIQGTVTGHIHSTINHPAYDGRTLLLVEREDASGARTGAYIVAVDRVGAGVGQRVLVLDEGSGARQILGSADAPVKSLVVGIVDPVET